MIGGEHRGGYRIWNPVSPSGVSSCSSTEWTSGRGRPLAAMADHRLNGVGRALEHDLDAAVAAVGGPACDPLVAGRVPGRVPKENSLHPAVNHETAADSLGGHAAGLSQRAIPSASRAPC